MQANIQLLKWRFENYYKEKKVPIWVFDPGYEVAYTNFTTSAILNLMESMRDLAKSFKPAHSIEGYHLYMENPYEMYFAMCHDVGKHQTNVLILGPVVTVKPTASIWNEMSFSGNLFAEQKRVLSHALPVMSPEDFKFELSEFLSKILEVTPPSFDLPSDTQNSKAPSNDKIDFSSFDNSELLTASEMEDLVTVEDQFAFYVTNGSTYQLYALFKDESSIDVLFPNKGAYKECMIRAVELLTMAKLASHDSGNDKKISQARFIKYTDQLKSCKTYDKIISIVEDAAIDFARNSHDLNAYTSDSYSPMTNKCIKRIIERLPDKVCLDELSKELHISSKYLSALFNRETGSSITDFMQDIRVNEAKRLLTSTDMTYLEISNFLNFSSQSYFNCIFKKKTDLTPKEYREQAKSSKSGIM